MGSGDGGVKAHNEVMLLVCLSQVVCEHSNLLASACAVARAFPLYSRKTRTTPPTQTVSVSFLLVGAGSAPSDPTPLTDDEVKCITALSEGGCGLASHW